MSQKNKVVDATNSLQKHYMQRYQKDGHPHFLMVMKPDDIKTWYVLFLNMAGPYADGEFLMKLEAPDNYPFAPPVFTFMTPNNRFKTDGKPCVDMGHYHSNNWSPQTGMYGFTVQIYYALNMPMTDLGGGIGIYTPKEQSDAKKQECAKASIEYNKKNYKEIMPLFEEERVRHQEKIALLPEESNSTSKKESKKESNPTSKKESKTKSKKESKQDDDDSVSSLSGPSESLSEEEPQKTQIKKSKSKSKKVEIVEDDSISSLSDVDDMDDVDETPKAPKKSSKSVAQKTNDLKLTKAKKSAK